MMGVRIIAAVLTLMLVGSLQAQTTAPSNADEPKAASDKITLHLAGDSTVMGYPATTVQEGWGQELGQFFKDKVAINNQAQGGASIQTFRRSARWTNIVSALKKGDFVMIQFGANDSGAVPGRHVDPADFQVALGEMAAEVKAKEATPIFVTPSAFYQWTADGKQDNARLAPYAASMVTVGAAKDVPVVDLNARGVEMLSKIGKTEATPLYHAPNGTVDKAHFLKPGAVKMAELIVGELKRIKSPLAEQVK